MSVGNCPECSNVVAESAKNCPNCGNRNFIVQTDSYIEICKGCSGSGRVYSHADTKLIVNDCGQCSGNGYGYQAFNVDCRNSHDTAHYRQLVKKYQGQEGDIFDAINDQAMNETFSDRGGQLRSETRKTAELSFWSDKTLRESATVDRTREEAMSSFGRSFKTAFTVWLVVGFGGCFVRILSTGGNDSNGPFKAYIFEGVIAGILVVALAGMSALLKVQKANAAKERAGKTMMNKLGGNE